MGHLGLGDGCGARGGDAGGARAPRRRDEGLGGVGRRPASVADRETRAGAVAGGTVGGGAAGRRRVGGGAGGGGTVARGTGGRGRGRRGRGPGWADGR